VFLVGDKLQVVDFGALASVDKLDNIGTVVRSGRKEAGRKKLEGRSREEEAACRVGGRRLLVWGIGVLLSGRRRGGTTEKLAVASLFRVFLPIIRIPSWGT
jgi:hypothetical protein